jgi:hypothetical protein
MTTPITGMFANLANGSTFTIGSNAFQACYQGHDKLYATARHG